MGRRGDRLLYLPELLVIAESVQYTSVLCSPAASSLVRTRVRLTSAGESVLRTRDQGTVSAFGGPGQTVVYVFAVLALHAHPGPWPSNSGITATTAALAGCGEQSGSVCFDRASLRLFDPPC